ncbi:hypothetical protein EG850_07795 [Gulosibacter macacae]|uniref:Uncharacterized protein n=1 Tax=Gulosibacter macacae TaxID=2488791 RepID=A0A3P3W0Y8_9MICO|nr:hypothetical protein [Gulosibacter macacae]RRJ86543.1 hypothetical protein EG850_07795 [Gulosibacter macacae]
MSNEQQYGTPERREYRAPDPQAAVAPPKSRENPLLWLIAALVAVGLVVGGYFGGNALSFTVTPSP